MSYDLRSFSPMRLRPGAFPPARRPFPLIPLEKLAAALGLLVAASLGVPGCGSSGERELARVRGTVAIKGQPLTRGRITFIPNEAGRPNATSSIAADGSYDLQTHEPGDGAELGEYRVAISDVATSEILDYIPKKKVERKATVSPKFASADSSGLTASVQRGSNQKNFDLDAEP